MNSGWLERWKGGSCVCGGSGGVLDDSIKNWTVYCCSGVAIGVGGGGRMVGGGFGEE